MFSGALAVARRGLGVTRLVRASVGVGVWLVVGCGASSGAPTPSGGSHGGAVGTGLGGNTGGPGAGQGTTSGGATASAQGGATSTAQGGATSTAQGGSSAAGMTSATSGGTTSGNGGATGTSGAPACQMANYSFVPKIPTVYVMVDRSGSMFDCLSTTNVEPSCGANMQGDPNDTAWVKLREATLTVLKSLQAQVRFGLATFTGTAGKMCPLLDKVAPALNNYDAIATFYSGLPAGPNSTTPGEKYESPARQSLDSVGADLIADTTPGDKYILFVTDGEPDYCDDGVSLCPIDSVVAGLQTLKAKGITTIIMGIKSNVGQVPASVLQAYANAGAGEPTLPSLGSTNGRISDIFDQCQGRAGWVADLMTSGKPAVRMPAADMYTTIGNYADAAGPTKPFAPDVADSAALVSQLGTALAGVKSCAFDLSNVGGQSIKVDLNQLSAAEVKVQGAAVPLDMTNGWSMASASQLVLNGTACDTWKKPEVKDIAFNFPCKTIIFE